MRDDLKFYVKFIRAVEEYPCLYDYSHDQYNSKTAVKAAWEIIGKQFDESALTCKSKWRSIRSSYLRMKSAISDGTAKRDYYLAPYLIFLDPFIKPNLKNISKIENSEDMVEVYSYEHLDINTELEDNAEGNIPEIKLRSSDITRNNNISKKRKIDTFDQNELFLLSLAPHLNSMKEKQLLSFQKSIVELIARIKYPDIKKVKSDEDE